MPNPLDISNIPAPRVDFIDPRTGLMAREWYRFFFNLFNLTGGGSNDTSLLDLQIGPPPINSVLGEINTGFDQSQLAAMSDQAEVVLGQLGLVYDQAQLASMIAQYEQATLNLQNQFDTLPSRPELGTIASYNLNGSPVAGGVGYGTGSAVAFTPAGTSGQFLTSAAAGTPTWTTPSSVAVTSFSAGTTGFTPSSATTGAVTLAGTLAVANGGTGAITLTGYVYGNGTGAMTASTSIPATVLSGTIAGDRGVTSGSTSSSFVEYNGTTATAGQFDGGTTTPTGSTRLNYGGWFYPTFLNLVGSADTATAATHYFVETATDGFVRPKTIANVRTEIVTNAAVLAGIGTLPVANGGTGITSFGTGIATWLGTPSSANLLAAMTDETGTGALVFGTSPTFTTSAIAPLVIGGTTTTSPLALRSTSGVGAAGADIIFQTGNNGATEAMRVLNSGNVGIGTSAPDYKLKIEQGLSNNNNGLFVSNTNYGSMQGLNISMVNAGSFNFGSYAVIKGYKSGVSGITHISLQPDEGNVSIGTATSSTKLDVKNTTTGSAIRATVADGAGSTDFGYGFYIDTTAHEIAAVNAVYTTSASGGSGALTFKYRNAGTLTEGMRLNQLGNVGIGTATNLSTLTVNGSFASKSPSTVNAATYTVAATDGSLRFTTTNCTVTLPAAASFPGRILYLNTITANSVISASSNVIPLGSNTAGTAILAATAAKFAMLQSDGTNWITMMSN